MLTVLITGAMGSGKSSAMAFLELKAYPVFRSDIQAKEMLKPQSPCYNRLKKLFKTCLSGPHGKFDKQKLAEEIFKYPEKRKAMEAIIHPLVLKSFEEFAGNHKKKGQNTVFCEAPLISHNILDFFNKRILLICPQDIKEKRLIKKGWTKKEIKRRWAAQIPESEITGKMDFVIDNSGDLKSLRLQIDEILQIINKSS